ncbi:hypothetical protein DSO57_1032273 [Entomophthora muscae]|uniref:Uncharacterized protein n=1 Tax=Entomophthora muscae TaxID=34485 RepID=A0ACC2T0M3_9FUNG|nr:hypothetical protein DSO57_1032273 [Entomophthora muscae]
MSSAKHWTNYLLFKRSSMLYDSKDALNKGFICVKIDNSPPLEPQAQEQELNLEPGFPQAAGPMDCGTVCPHFSGVKPPQAEAEDDGSPSETD